MAVSVLPLIALVLVTLHTGNAARTGPELTGEPGAPDPIKAHPIRSSCPWRESFDAHQITSPLLQPTS